MSYNRRRRPQLLTNQGHDFYEVASGMQKAIRRGDALYAGYFALELFPRYYKYVWKRLLTVSAEDLAGVITQEIVALYDAFMIVNEGKKSDKLGGRIFISKAVLLMCEVKTNRDADLLQNYIHDKKALLTDEKIAEYMSEIEAFELDKMPEYVFDVHTLKGKRMGKTKTDFMKEEQEALQNEQLSMFDTNRLFRDYEV